MLTNKKILDLARKTGRIYSSEISEVFGVSRQYVSILIARLVEKKELIRFGSTRNAFYVLPEYVKLHPESFPKKFTKKLRNTNLEEHKILSEIEEKFPQLIELQEHIRNIFTFAFSEMLNNAIEHSDSRWISLEIIIDNNELSFSISDTGVGVFRNVMRKKNLRTELEAVQDILKGKTTTTPKSHTGQGIFFTSKASDIFILNSFGQEMTVNDLTKDVEVKQKSKKKKGTQVIFKIKIDSTKHLSEIFKKFTNLNSESDYGFDKTEIRVSLYTASGINISRSQARRILHGLEKFSIVLFDFDRVPMIGQAFADEIFRVFQNKHPNIELQIENMNDAVKFMVERAKTDAGRQ